MVSKGNVLQVPFPAYLGKDRPGYSLVYMLIFYLLAITPSYFLPLTC